MQARDTGDYQYNTLKASAIVACFVAGYTLPSGKTRLGLAEEQSGDLTDQDGNSITRLQPGMLLNLGKDGDWEMAQAFALAGFEAELRLVSDLIAERVLEKDLYPRYAVVALPGGKSYQDDFGAGQILSLLLKHKLGWSFETYAQKGGLVIGTGDGFHALIRCGVFGKEISLLYPTVQNFGEDFLNWVKVTPTSRICPWLKGLGSFVSPMKSSQNRLVVDPSRRVEVLGRLKRKGQICLRFESREDVSTSAVESDETIRFAGLCDPTGRIFGTFIEPQGFVRWTSHPEWTLNPERAQSPGQGLAIFDNAYQEVMRATPSL
jgi:phosphoribosylformylglycinamidine synthase